MTPPKFRVVSSIYEADQDYAAVQHIFTAYTATQAVRLYQAHMQSDAFLKACVTKSRFGVGTAAFECSEHHECQQLVGTKWTKLNCRF